jgi:hypothetical protein
MAHHSPYEIPEQPPPDALAELDAAAGALDALALRSASLTLGMDERTRTLRIELDEGAGATTLTPTQLFALLGPS